MTASKVKCFFNTTRQLANLAFGGLNHLLWPAVCNCCSKSIPETSNGLCQDCWDELLRCSGGDYCRRCGRDAGRYSAIDTGCANCQNTEIDFDGVARGGVYDGVLRDMILDFKFNGRTELDSQLCFLANSALQGSSFRNEIDIFVPVPLHWRRKIERGYNQSLILCKGLDPHAAKIDTDLVRIRHTEKQWNLSLKKRKSNVAGAFAIRKRHNFSGRNICLVDDITTTWATLNECAKTLKQAGALKVFAIVVAVAMQEMGG